MKDLSQYRKSYEKSELSEATTPTDPMELFNLWFHEAEAAHAADEINAMSVTTIETDGFPKARIVLLKQYSDEGFIFFTNYESAKGQAIAHNPNVGLSFFWHGAERQVIIKGVAEKVAEEVSDLYFKSRPKGSRLGALVSKQSSVVSSRNELEDLLATLTAKYEDDDIPRPKHWGGYIVKPVEIEFWQGRVNRLHDRLLYKSEDGKWTKVRLAP